MIILLRAPYKQENIKLSLFLRSLHSEFFSAMQLDFFNPLGISVDKKNRQGC